MRAIEITSWKQTGDELVQEISNQVDAEAKAMNEVPSKIIMNRNQYNSMVRDELFIPMYDPGVTNSGIIYNNRVKVSGDQMFITKDGYPLEVEVADVMEIEDAAETPEN